MFQNEVAAGLGGTINTEGDISIEAAGHSDLFNIAAAVAVAARSARRRSRRRPIMKEDQGEGRRAGADFDADGKRYCSLGVPPCPPRCPVIEPRWPPG